MRSVAFFASLATVIGLASQALAAVPAWGQCGGQGYSGETTCAAGSTCVASSQLRLSIFYTKTHRIG
jgi:uncharacterized membrane protein